MNRQELIKLAESGNTQAIEELTKQLFQEKDQHDTSHIIHPHPYKYDCHKHSLRI